MTNNKDEIYTLSINPDTMSFSSVHFISFESAPKDCKCEMLHGHNYKVEMKVCGTLNQHGYVVDFSDLKRELKAVLKKYDNRILLATQNPLISISQNGDETKLEYDGKHFLFPSSNVVLINRVNTTAEILASEIFTAISDNFLRKYKNVKSAEVCVEEKTGQRASCGGKF